MDEGRGAGRERGQDPARPPYPAGSRAAAAGPGEAGDAAAAPTRQEEEEGEEEDVRPRTEADTGSGTGTGWPQTPTLPGRGPRGMGVPWGSANSSLSPAPGQRGDPAGCLKPPRSEALPYSSGSRQPWPCTNSSPARAEPQNGRAGKGTSWGCAGTALRDGEQGMVTAAASGHPAGV